MNIESKKEILLCCNSDIGRGNTIGFRFGKVAQYLFKKGITPEIIARDNYIKNLKVKIPFYGNLLSRSLRALRIYFFPSFNHRKLDVYFFERFALKVLKKSKQKFSLAHFGEYAPKVISYLKKNGTKIILDIPIAHHSYAAHLESKGFLLDEKIGRVPEFLKKSIELADLLIVPSEFVKKTLGMAKIEKPMEIVPFGADLPKNFSERDIERKKIPIKFIFAGNVNRRKGVNFLLEAWDKLNLKNAELLICGRLYKTIRQELKHYKLKNVKFCGFVNLDKYFREANVFVFPTLFEGSAKVVYEAMSYGLPVITTPNAGSIVENQKSGFIIPIGDVNKLAKKMSYFYHHPEEIKRTGKNAFGQVKNYTWENYAKNMVKVYKTLL